MAHVGAAATRPSGRSAWSIIPPPLTVERVGNATAGLLNRDAVTTSIERVLLSPEVVRLTRPPRSAEGRADMAHTRLCSAPGSLDHVQFLARLVELELRSTASARLTSLSGVSSRPGSLRRSNRHRRASTKSRTAIPAAQQDAACWISRRMRLSSFRQRENVILLGDAVGLALGKTHVALALGLAACQNLISLREAGHHRLPSGSTRSIRKASATRKALLRGRGPATARVKPHADRLHERRIAVAALADRPADTLGCSNVFSRRYENPAPQSSISNREHFQEWTIGVRQHERLTGMRDDLDRHGDCRHGGGGDGARAGCSRASSGAPACGQPDATTDPKPSPDLAVVPRPPRAMPPGRPRSPPAEPRPRSRASVPGALLVGAQRWPAAGISWRRTRNGQNPRPHRPAGGRRPNPCRERWRHSSPRPPPPQRAGRLRLGLQQFHLHDQLPDPLHGDVQFRLHRIALAFLERGIDPADRLLTPLLEPENLHAQLPRQKFHRLATQKPQGNLTLARKSPSTAGQVPAGLPAKPGPGKTWTSQARPRLPPGPSTATLFSKIVGHVPVLLGHFD